MSMDEVHELVDTLFAGGGDELISKMNPTQSDIATHKDRKKRAITAGLSATGAAAGAGGFALAGREMHHGYKQAKAGAQGVWGKNRPLRATVGNKKLATALLPLEAVGLGGELMATKILHGDTKKKPGTVVRKDLGDMLNNSK